ncbi:hypothetical protein Q2941_17425 [Bradyrhizobium sp. UFLA05-153]
MRIDGIEGVRVETRFTRKRAALRGEAFIKVPLAWHDALDGAGGRTWQLALHLLMLRFREHSATVKLGNKTLSLSRRVKWRALRDLERRGLIAIESRGNGKSPIVRLGVPTET